MTTRGDLIRCKSCGEAVSGAVEVCPHCAAPLTAPPADQARSSEPAPGKDLPPMCPNCQREVRAGATVCLSCGYELVDASSAVAVSSLESQGTRRPLVPGSPIVLGDGERVWRQYRVMAFPPLGSFSWTPNQPTGMLCVTDSRVLFYASHQARGRRSVVVQETQLQHVTGLQAYTASWLNWPAFLISLLIGLLGLTVLDDRPVLGIFLLLIAIAGGVLLLHGFGRGGSVGLRIQSSSSQNSSVGFGVLGAPRRALGPLAEALTRSFGPRDATDLLLAWPGPDAERVIVELGALIADLQAKGDLVRTHWGIEGDQANQSPA